MLTPDVNPRYMAHILEREGKIAGFSRSYRASLDRIRGAKFHVPDIHTQNSYIDEVRKLEASIKECQTRLKAFIGVK